MRCLACDDGLSDREANRKYVNSHLIESPEERYIGLCDGCLRESDLFYQDEAAENEGEEWVGEGE